MMRLNKKIKKSSKSNWVAKALIPKDPDDNKSIFRN